MPRIVHFIFGLRPQREPFHLLHYLALASCRQVLAPDEIRLHVHELPYGIYWDLARPLVTLERIEPVQEIAQRHYDPVVGAYRYAHHADVIRLDLLARHGGLYADIDTLFLRPVPDAFWAEPAVIGHEADVVYPDVGAPEISVTNALLMAQPASPFIVRWRQQILNAMDGTWSGHSCRLATRLASDHPDEVRVEPQSSFSPFDHTPQDITALLQGPHEAARLAQAYSVHLCAHLWWDLHRTDFSTVSAPQITERYLRESETPIGFLARPFLPGLF